MTAAELRELLRGLPDDAPVLLEWGDPRCAVAVVAKRALAAPAEAAGWNWTVHSPPSHWTRPATGGRVALLLRQADEPADPLETTDVEWLRPDPLLPLPPAGDDSGVGVLT